MTYPSFFMLSSSLFAKIKTSPEKERSDGTAREFWTTVQL